MLGEWLGAAVAVKRYADDDPAHDPARGEAADDEFRAELAALSSLIHPKVPVPPSSLKMPRHRPRRAAAPPAGGALARPRRGESVAATAAYCRWRRRRRPQLEQR